MAARFDSVRDLNSSKKTWRICVRICRKWTRKGYAKFPLSLKLVLVDHEGAFLHATVKSDLIRQFDDKIVENETYELSYFKVESVPLKDAICNNAFKIKFNDQTSVLSPSVELFSMCIYNFKSFLPILTDGVDDQSCPLFDVIGHVVCVYKDAGNGNVEFILQDLDYISLGFLIRPPFSKKEIAFIDRGMSGSLNQEVVIIQLCRSEYYKGRVVIESYGKATKINFNCDSDSATTYRLSLSYRKYCPVYRYLSHGTQSIPQNVVSISSLVRANDVMTVWSIGCISDIVNKNNWFINVCDNCKFKRQVQHSNEICSWCNECFPKNLKFKVCVSVSNGVSNVILCLLNDVVVDILGMTASEAMKVRSQGPFQILSLIGKDILFKVNIASCHIDGREKVYDVAEYNCDPDLLKLHKGLLHVPRPIISDASSSNHPVF